METFFFDGTDGAARRQDRPGVDRSTIYELELRINRAVLTMEALWSLLAEHTELTEDDLVRRIVEIDGADGRIDGKRKVEPVECEGCGRATSRRHPKCLYCGQPVTIDPFS